MINKILENENHTLSFENLEYKYNKLRWGVSGLFLLWILTVTGIVFIGANWQSNSQSVSKNGILKVRGIIVVDDNGTPRVQIGAPLPDPPVLGKRIDRGDKAHGILLFDAEGNERSGYVTFDQSGIVMITLDEVGTMVGQFSASPVGGVRLWMRDEYQNDVKLGAYEGGPYLRMIKKDKELMLQPNDKELK